jgi:hypothetical protein
VRTHTGIVLGLLVWAAPAVAHADDGGAITGEVVSAQGRWTRSGLIVTDTVLRTDDGTLVAVLQAGGRAGGYGQLSWPAPPRLEVGMRATVHAPRGIVTAANVLASPGIPFVRTGPTESGNYLKWASGCVFLTVDEAGTGHLAGDDELAVVAEVVATWNNAIDGCSYLTLMLDPPIEAGGAIGNDGINRIVFRDDVWCRPATDDTPEMCLPGGAAGLTTVTYVDDTDSSRDGEIVDADVELNGEEFAISDDGTTLGSPTCLADLANTLAHELGHVMGLDHTCLAPSDPPKIDDQGNAVPLCSATTDPAITLATMYNFQECGETTKASPEDDDVDAICSVYANTDDPGSCVPVGDDPPGCCSLDAGRGGSPAGPALLALTALLAATRRRSRSG